MNFIKSLIARFFHPSVDGILSSMTKKIDQLHVASRFHDAEAVAHDEAMKVAAAAKAFAEKESERARTAAANFRKLIGV
jgi:hypothetical protein